MTNPNLVFILADQWRASALGVAADDPVHTPNLDRLAGQGLRLTHAVSNYPVCSPYRAMLMSGQYPPRNSVRSNFNSVSDPEVAGLPATGDRWADVLTAAGYDTAYLGKWHLDRPVPADARYGEGVRAEDGLMWDAYTPPSRRQGFQRWYSHGCSDQHFHPHYWIDDAEREAPHQVEQWSASHETDVAVELIADAGARFHTDGTPFAYMLSYNPPHPPFNEVPPEYLARYAETPISELLIRPNVDTTTSEGLHSAEIVREYYAAITAVDEQIGRVLTALDEANLAEDTLVVFTSDHGMQLGSHGLLAKNVWFDESLRVPFIVRFPGRLRTGIESGFLSAPDIAPTLLGLLGQQAPGSMQGRDLTLSLTGETTDMPTSALYFCMPSTADPDDYRGLRTDTHLVVCALAPGGPEPIELYDLREDPYQQRNVLSNQPDVAHRLTTDMVAQLHEIGDPWVTAA